MLISQEYSRRLEGTNITSNSIHPGVIRTNLASDTESFKVKLISMFAGPFTRTIPQGAATHCFVAAHPSLEGVSGQHFADSNPKEPKDHPLVKDVELAGRLFACVFFEGGLWIERVNVRGGSIHKQVDNPLCFRSKMRSQLPGRVCSGKQLAGILKSSGEPEHSKSGARSLQHVAS